MLPTPNLSLNSILDDEFVTNLAKSADLYKIGSNSILDPEEIRIGLKVVPRAVMSMLINELTLMPLNSSKRVQLPFGHNAWMDANKNAADDYTGSVYSNNKLVYDFKNRSIPGLGIILLSTFELYDLEELSKPHKESDEVDKKIQKLIDERMEMHSLISRVVENKIAEREAIHKIMMDKLTEALSKPIATNSTPIATNPVAIPPIATNTATVMAPIELKSTDVVKKESTKKTLPLKKFLDRKKKPKEYHVEMAKSETVDCESCGKTIFGPGGYSGCICMGSDQHKKIWIKKSEDSVEIRFSKGWDEQNIEMLLDTLRRKHERD